MNFLLFLMFKYPKWLWDNLKVCPLWNYPYCNADSLVTGKNVCRLGDAKNLCRHYVEIENKYWDGTKFSKTRNIKLKEYLDKKGVNLNA